MPISYAELIQGEEVLTLKDRIYRLFKKNPNDYYSLGEIKEHFQLEMPISSMTEAIQTEYLTKFGANLLMSIDLQTALNILIETHHIQARKVVKNGELVLFYGLPSPVHYTITPYS